MRTKKKNHQTEVPASLIQGTDSFVTNESILSESSAERFCRFLVVKGISSDLSKASPFVVDRELKTKIGIVASVRKIKDGLLIETANRNQSDILLRIQKLCNLDVRVEPHATLNSCRGVISSPDLLNCSIEEMKSELRPQCVIDVRRITSIRNGERCNTTSVILTFDMPILPSYIKVGYLRLKVRPYIPAPLRCYNCQRFGHSSVRCSKDKVCICGLSPHEGVPCQRPLVCINCGLDHSARSKLCPVYIEEAEIQRIKVMERISYIEARRRVRGSNLLSSSNSYAQAASRSSLNSKDVKELAAMIVPEIIRLLEQNGNTNKSPKKVMKSYVTSKRAVSDTDGRSAKFIPTSVLRKKASTKSNDPTSVKNLQIPTTSVESTTAKRKEEESIQMEISSFINAIENSYMNRTSRTSETEERSSVRERSTSESSTERPPKKKITSEHQILDNDIDDDTEESIFDHNKLNQTENHTSTTNKIR